MFFILERENPHMKVEYFLWKHLLDDNKHSHSYIECTADDIHDLCAAKEIPNGAIPLGSIKFTNICLQILYGISQMNPIEIPKCLRNEYFLGRQYAIMPHHQLPTEGCYFIKNASEMKKMSYSGSMIHLNREELDHHAKYVVSELVDIISEYRVYVIRGNIYAIEYYNGDPCILPDVNKIKAANLRFSVEKIYPGSYTIDVMVTNKGTFLTEIHPVLFACGLYTTVLSDSFLDGYHDSLRYILAHNASAELS